MCDLEKQSTNLPEPTGPTDDSLTYSVTERGQRALAARLHLDAERSACRRASARALRQQGRAAVWDGVFALEGWAQSPRGAALWRLARGRRLRPRAWV
jgi:hypothetical protein